MRIACGGFHHETNTFAPVNATFADFEAADGWPALSRGEWLRSAIAGMNLPVAGFWEAAEANGHELAPLLWCSAVPSAQVTADAFERIVGMMLADLAAAMPVDALFLDLHGAMVCTHLEDGEGALLDRVRALVGPDLPIVVALDLHANVTERMMALSDVMVAYRTYPHVDMAETGRRAAALLERVVNEGRPQKTFRKLPFLIPLVWQCTLTEPAAGLYRRLEELEADSPSLLSLSFTPGFPPADIGQCGPTVFGYGERADLLDHAVSDLERSVAAAEADFAGTLFDPDDAVDYAKRHGRRGAPLVIADTQDNPGAGGNSDTVGMLEALVRNGARDAVFAVLYDPDAAASAHEAGEGADIRLPIGAKSSQEGQFPYEGSFTVTRLADGNFTATGPMFGGSRMTLGPMAVLKTGGVEIIVASKKMQAADKAIFRHVGIEPAERSILVVKSSVHFRADFTDIAGEIIVATAPGPNLADHEALDYQRLRAGVRLMPTGRTFEGAGQIHPDRAVADG